MWVAFANAKATHISFSKNISIYAISNDQSFNDTLTNDIVSFEQLGPEHYLGHTKRKGVYEHAQNTQIQIHPAHAPSLIRVFALHRYVLYCLMFLLAYTKRPWSDCGCAGWSESSLFAYAHFLCSGDPRGLENKWVCRWGTYRWQNRSLPSKHST